MKFTQQIEVLLKEFNSINVQLAIISKKYNDRKQLNYKIASAYVVNLGILMLILISYFTEWSILQTAIVTTFLAPFGYPIQMTVRWLSEKMKKTGFQTTAELKNKILHLTNENNIIEKKLNEKLFEHIERIKNLINKRHKAKPTRRIYKISDTIRYYIHCQYFQITDIIKLLDSTYKIYWKQKNRTFYLRVENEFSSLHSDYKLFFYPKLKSINIK